jgi:hypothetical protein
MSLGGADRIVCATEETIGETSYRIPELLARNSIAPRHVATTQQLR